jgi:hypothetical protein
MRSRVSNCGGRRRHGREVSRLWTPRACSEGSVCRGGERRRKPTKPEVIRVGVLTYAGIHVAEVEPVKLQDDDSPVPAAVYAAGRELLMTISMVSRTMNKE